MEQIRKYPKVVTPNGRVEEPASCWMVTVDMHSEQELRRALEDPSTPLGRIMEQFGADDLAPLLRAGQAAQERAKGPDIVCICGSARYREKIAQVHHDLTLKGVVALAPAFSNQPVSDDDRAAIDTTFRRKIDLCTGIYVVNPDDYIGEHTAAEITYAKEAGKEVWYLRDPEAPTEVVVGRWYPEMPPMLRGETNGEYTDRLTGADGTDRRPYDHPRNRQCSLGWHEECSDRPAGGNSCFCPCHPLGVTADGSAGDDIPANMLLIAFPEGYRPVVFGSNDTVTVACPCICRSPKPCACSDPDYPEGEQFCGCGTVECIASTCARPST